jgi:hypothetical protein
MRPISCAAITRQRVDHPLADTENLHSCRTFPNRWPKRIKPLFVDQAGEPCLGSMLPGDSILSASRSNSSATKRSAACRCRSSPSTAISRNCSAEVRNSAAVRTAMNHGMMRKRLGKLLSLTRDLGKVRDTNRLRPSSCAKSLGAWACDSIRVRRYHSRAEEKGTGMRR